jgi:ribosomal protein S12 methylthiotransferase accessory factor
LTAAVELQPVGWTPVETALPRLRSFVSPLSGVVRRLAETLAAPDEHRLVSIGCELADGSGTIGSALESYTGSEHWIREVAEAAAIGEALERYSGSYVPDDRLVVASADDLGGSAVRPERFALFSDAQHATPGFPFTPFSGRTVVSWIDGFSVPDGTHVHLPAQLVLMAPRRLVRGEARIGYATSSGLACAPTLEEALLTGVLELIERDAFMLVWHNRLSLPLLDWRGDPELVRLDSRYFEPSGLRYSAVDLSVFLAVPTVLGVVHGADRQLGAIGVGAGCAPTVAGAWRKALAEAFSVQRWVRDKAYEEPELIGRAAAAIHTFDAHTLYYACEERARRAAFLDASPRRRDSREIAPLQGGNVLELIEQVARRLAERGVSAYGVDVTSPDVRAGGLRVVRAVVPELCALDVVEGARFLGGGRMYRAAFEAGLVSRPFQPADLNPDPHPFP